MKELFKKIGLETMADLQRFKAEEQGENETLEQTLVRYANELGTDFRIMEVQNGI